MSTQVAKPVAFCQFQRRTPTTICRNKPYIRGINIAKPNTKRRNLPIKKLQKTVNVMSDADTEGSVNTNRSEDDSRKYSITSSESDGGPHIIVQSTSPEEDEEDASPNLPIPYLLSVSGLESVTTTDIGSDYTSEGGDSSVEVEIQSVTPEVKAALVKQLEEYLSDEGLANDLFLLKHVKRHRDGFVSLKLLSGYKRVKKLSRNWRVLSLALRGSLKLEVNEEGTKVRRRTPLPSSLLYDAPASRALVAVDVPAKHATMGGLASLFGAYGGVASLQVIRPKPGGGVPPELQPLLSRIPEIATTISAIIEYEDVWGAAKALREVKPPMTLHVLRKTKRSDRQSGFSSRNSPTPTPTPNRGRTYGNKCHNGVHPEELRSRLRGSRSRQSHYNHRESSASDGEEGRDGNMSWRRDPSHRNLTPQPHLRTHYRRPIGSSMSTPSSPIPHRRAHHNQYQQTQQQKQFGVLRDPRGPDGTKGFSRSLTQSTRSNSDA